MIGDFLYGVSQSIDPSQSAAARRDANKRREQQEEVDRARRDRGFREDARRWQAAYGLTERQTGQAFRLGEEGKNSDLERQITQLQAQTEELRKLIPSKTDATIKIGASAGDQQRRTLATLGETSENFDTTTRGNAAKHFKDIFPMVNQGVMDQQSNTLKGGLQYAIDAELLRDRENFERMMTMRKAMQPKLSTALLANAPGLLGTVLEMFGA